MNEEYRQGVWARGRGEGRAQVRREAKGGHERGGGRGTSERHGRGEEMKVKDMSKEQVERERERLMGEGRKRGEK